jgi:hypothetical protein
MKIRGRKAGLAVKTALFLASLALLMVSCASPDEGRDLNPASNAASTPANETPSIGQAPTPTGPITKPYPSIPEGLERIESTQQSTISGDVPAGLLEDILEDLSSRLEIDPQDIEVVKGEAALWPDGSLGCPQPGEYYTQAAVPGYWIILQVDDATYDYRTSESSHFFLCEQPLPLVPSNP